MQALFPGNLAESVECAPSFRRFTPGNAYFTKKPCNVDSVYGIIEKKSASIGQIGRLSGAAGTILLEMYSHLSAKERKESIL